MAEVAKMKDKEIFLRLIELIDEGNNYFVNSRVRTVEKDEFYKTMLIGLGRQKNSSAGRHLMSALKRMKKKLVRSPMHRRPLDDVHYMVILGNAIADSGSKGFAKDFGEMRWDMGQGGEFWKRTGKAYERLADLDGIDQNNPVSAMGFFQRGMTKYADKEFDSAITDFNEAIKLDSRLAKAHLHKGNAYFELNKYPQALESYGEAIQIKQLPLAYNNRGYTKKHMGLLEEAIEDYDYAVALDSEYPDAYTNRGIAKMELGRFRESIKDFSQAIRVNPKHAWAFSCRSQAKKSIRDYRGALKDATQAIHLDPELAGGYNNRGQVKEDQGDLEGALQDYNRAIGIDPKNSYAYNNRGLVKLKQKNLEGALEDFNQAILLNGKHIDAYSNRGVVHFYTENKRKAKEDFKTFLRLTRKSKNKNHKNAKKWIFQNVPSLRSFR